MDNDKPLNSKDIRPLYGLLFLYIPKSSSVGEFGINFLYLKNSYLTTETRCIFRAFGNYTYNIFKTKQCPDNLIAAGVAGENVAPLEIARKAFQGPTHRRLWCGRLYSSGNIPWNLALGFSIPSLSF